jgi:CRISPR-associated endonuclease/helicase Cas3
MDLSDATIDSIETLVEAAMDACDEHGFDPKWSEEDRKAPDQLAAAKAVRALRGAFEVEPHPSGRGWLLRGKRRMDPNDLEFSGEDDGASRSNAAVTLEQHLCDVEAVAGQFSRKLLLSASIGEDIQLSGALHDAGKADPCFQAILHGGSRLHAAASTLLAKSSNAPTSLAEARHAQFRSGYPEGGRHELLSVRLAESDPHLKTLASDWELVLHLVASHHGRCRPFAPVVDHPAPRTVQLDWRNRRLSASSDGVVDGMGIEHVASGVTERFGHLVRRYGWWGLSYLEACVRLADWKASSLEAKGEHP